jgi:hypothetical protein
MKTNNVCDGQPAELSNAARGLLVRLNTLRWDGNDRLPGLCHEQQQALRELVSADYIVVDAGRFHFTNLALSRLDSHYESRHHAPDCVLGAARLRYENRLQQLLRWRWDIEVAHLRCMSFYTRERELPQRRNEFVIRPLTVRRAELPEGF